MTQAAKKSTTNASSDRRLTYLTSYRTEGVVLTAVVFMVLLWSAIAPFDRVTWWLEVAPALLAIPLLWITFTRFPFTPLTYRWVCVHCIILIVGGHYTYANVPIGHWFQDVFDLSRNHYDRLGHIAQGFVPALVIREILLRRSPLVAGKWLFFLVSATALAISAFYEFIEWWVALAAGIGAENFLGTQGDPWDTQWDMFLAMSGSIVAQLVFGSMQDRQLHKIGCSAPHDSAS